MTITFYECPTKERKFGHRYTNRHSHTDTQTYTAVVAETETETENMSGKKLSYNAISQGITSN